MKKIFLADDHPIYREGLRFALLNTGEYEIVGESGDGKDALERITLLKPDLAIIDISMPSMSGIEVSAQIKRTNPEIKVLILSQHDDEDYIRKVLQIGVQGYVLKDSSPGDFLRSVAEVLNGNMYLTPKIQNLFFQSYSSKTRYGLDELSKTSFESLSAREVEILILIAEGKTNAEIASGLMISEKTVRSHRLNIMNKLNIRRMSDLIMFAVKKGLVKA